MPDRPISFAGCDYLGLARDPRVVAAARAALDRDGVGTGASRTTTGGRPVHDALERELAAFLGTEDAVLLPTGTLAGLAAGAALLAPSDAIHVDPRAHASLLAAARLAGGPSVDDPGGARAILTDGVFPSRGEIAPLAAMLASLPADGRLIVDDGHGLGVTGPGGRGTVAAAGLDDPRVVQVLTLSKAMGSAGGAVAGTRRDVERVRDHPLHVGATALPPAFAAAASVALAILRDEPDRHASLRRAIADARELLPAAGVELPTEELPVFRIDGPGPVLAELSSSLMSDGFLVPHIRYPDGPVEGYIRLVVPAPRTRAEIAALADALAPHLRRAPFRRMPFRRTPS